MATEKKISDKRKADTDCKNSQFELTIKERTAMGPDDHKQKNMRMVSSMNSGRPLAQRLELPEGSEVYGYGNQKLSIWEFQKEQLRKQIE